MESTRRHKFLMSGLSLFVVLALYPGCGLIDDAVQHLTAAKQDELETICQRRQLRVGITAEPFRPLLFPAILTEQGPRVTGLDIELIRELRSALAQECRQEVVAPLLHRVPLRDLFTSLNEGKIDVFVSAVGANVPAPNMAGVAYSLPYLFNGGIVGITKRPDVVDRVQASLRTHGEGFDARERALSGLTVAVQEGTGAHAYAIAQLTASRVVVVDSLPAAFEADDPTVDVILGSHPVLKFATGKVQTDWQLITLESGRPFFLTKEHYAIVMPERSYKLRWFVNRLLLRLEETGRLHDMQQRWFDQDYTYSSRALTEGLLVAIETPARRSPHDFCHGGDYEHESLDAKERGRCG